MDGYLKCYVELECLNLDQIWWVDKPTRLDALESRNPDLHIEVSLCPSCGQQSRYRTYNEISICTNFQCEKVDTDPTVTTTTMKENLTRSEALLHRTAVPASTPKVALNLPSNKQTLRDIDAEESGEVVVEKGSKSSAVDRALLCEQCGGSVVRTLFTGWACQTHGCDWTLTRPPTLDSMLLSTKKRHVYKDPEFSLRSIDISQVHKVYDLGEHEGYHFRVVSLYAGAWLLKMTESEQTARKEGGSYDQHQLSCKEAISGKLHMEKGLRPKEDYGEDKYTGIFYRSCGVKYRFGSEYPHYADDEALPVEAESFERLGEIREMGLTFLGCDPTINFWDERMAAVYFPGQYLKAHDDNDTASPIITRGLGADETFEMSINKEWYYGSTQTGDPGTTDAPEHGTYRDVILCKAWARCKVGTPNADVEGYQVKKEEILNFKPKDTKGTLLALRWTAGHGDVIMMIGERIQDVYKHAFVAHGHRIG